MKWEMLLHSFSDPAWALGLAMQARRAGEAAMPLAKRLLLSIGPIVLSAALSAGGAIFGTMQAFSAQINDLHAEDIRIRGLIAERTSLRENQMTQFSKMCSETQARVMVLESRQRDADMLVAELRALMRHEAAEIDSR